MLSQKDILIIIPAYNEAESVGEVVRGVHTYLPEAGVLVIDDGSSDATGVVSQQAGALVLRHPFNLGVGTALQTGYKYAVQNHYQYVIQLDGDGQHPTSFLPNFVSKLIETEADLIIGSRFLKQSCGKMPATRHLGNMVFARLVTLLIGETLTDPTSGYRALKSTALQFCVGDMYGFDYPDADFLLALHRTGYRIEEIAIDVHPRKRGVSQYVGLKPIYYVIKMFLSIFITLLRPKGPRHRS
ncbi:MAG TPA: glycosyl transferase family 2 [Bacteroidetes bacterium]|nr:glycosyl transferase family 2 [Bacteroidota bacterium]